MTLTNYFCFTYTADDCVSANEQCDNAETAIARANAWRAIGTKATAYRMVLDCETLEVYHYPLN